MDRDEHFEVDAGHIDAAVLERAAGGWAEPTGMPDRFESGRLEAFSDAVSDRTEAG